jgi:hypothetical protein
MNNYQLNQKEAIRTQDVEPFAILFFFMGALDIYSSLKRKIRERQEKYEDRLRSNEERTIISYAKVALLALIVAGVIEISLF